MSALGAAVLGRLAVAFGIGALFVAAAHYFVGFRSLVYPWRYMADSSTLVVACALLVSTYLIRAYRLYRYLHLEHGFDVCTRILLQHTWLVNLLPFRIGELSFPALLKRHLDIPAERSLPTLLWLRALDFHALLLFPIVIATFALPLGTAAGALAAGLIWLGLPLVAASLAETLVRFTAARKGRPARLLHKVASAVPRTMSEVIENWLLTLLNWLVKLAVYGWIIRAFSKEHYLAALAGAIGGELSSALPVQGLAGFGTYEAGVVAGMRTFGIDVNDALTGAVNLHLMVLGVSLAGAILAFALPRKVRDPHGRALMILETCGHDVPADAETRGGTDRSLRAAAIQTRMRLRRVLGARSARRGPAVPSPHGPERPR